MIQALIDYIEQFVKLDSDVIEALETYVEIESYKKKEYILEQGQHCHKIWFLKKGMVRKYHLSEGKEVTTWIHTESETFTSLQSYAQGIGADEFLQACEATELIGISKTNSQKLIQYPQMLIFTNTLMEQQFVNIDKHTKALNQRDAKGKYEYIRSIAPEMVKRAQIGHIASIIGISRETLSRIRHT